GNAEGDACSVGGREEVVERGAGPERGGIEQTSRWAIVRADVEDGLLGVAAPLGVEEALARQRGLAAGADRQQGFDASAKPRDAVGEGLAGARAVGVYPGARRRRVRLERAVGVEDRYAVEYLRDGARARVDGDLAQERLFVVPRVETERLAQR